MRARSAVSAIVIVLALAACDSAPDDELPFRDEGGGGDELAEADPSPTELPSLSSSPSPSLSPSDPISPSPSGSPSPDATSGPEGGNDDRGRRRPKPRFAFPRAGSYTYDQQGYEEFCTASCASDPLPGQRVVSIAHGWSSRDAIAIVETAEVSSHRTSTTVIRHTRTAALVVRASDEFSSRGSTYRTAFQPGPAIAMFRVPLSEGAEWRGSWQARTSGDYRMAVQGFDVIRVAGGSHRAARVQARIEFRGQLDGYLVTTWWVDPRTRVVIASVGSMELRDGFGRYTTDFDTRLSAGPGY